MNCVAPLVLWVGFICGMSNPDFEPQELSYRAEAKINSFCNDLLKTCYNNPERLHNTFQYTNNIRERLISCVELYDDFFYEHQDLLDGVIAYPSYCASPLTEKLTPSLQGLANNYRHMFKEPAEQEREPKKSIRGYIAQLAKSLQKPYDEYGHSLVHQLFIIDKLLQKSGQLWRSAGYIPIQEYQELFDKERDRWLQEVAAGQSPYQTVEALQNYVLAPRVPISSRTPNEWEMVYVDRIRDMINPRYHDMILSINKNLSIFSPKEWVDSLGSIVHWYGDAVKLAIHLVVYYPHCAFLEDIKEFPSYYFQMVKFAHSGFNKKEYHLSFEQHDAFFKEIFTPAEVKNHTNMTIISSAQRLYKAFETSPSAHDLQAQCKLTLGLIGLSECIASIAVPQQEDLSASLKTFEETLIKKFYTTK